MTSSSKIKVIFIWVVGIAITALLITLLVIRINSNKIYDSYSDIENTKYVIKDIAGQEESKYYVYIYSSKDEYDAYKKSELETAVTTYFTFTRQHKDDEDIVPLYLYDINKFRIVDDYTTCATYLEALNSNLSITDTPVLVLVSDGVVSSVYTTVGGTSGIEATLVSAMKTIEAKDAE